MKRSYFYKLPIVNDHGITVVFVAVVLLVLIGMASLAIDIGYIAVTKTELQNAADAAALAAGKEIGLIYVNSYGAEPVTSPLNATQRDQVVAVAQNMVRDNNNNVAGGTNVNVEVEIVQWQGQVDAAVEVSVQTSIDFFFAKVLGINAMDISVNAKAALTPLGYVQSDLIPVAISSAWFGDDFSDDCGRDISLYPVTDSCVAWHNFDPENVDVYTMKNNVLLKMYMPDDEFKNSLSAGDMVQITGNTGPEEYGDLYDWFRLVYEDDNLNRGYYLLTPEGDKIPKYTIDTEGNTVRDEWYHPITSSTFEAFKRELPTNVIVFQDDADSPTCSADLVSGQYEIVGYTRLIINEVVRMPNKKVVATVKCDPNYPIIVNGRGAGQQYYGLKGAIPTLVE